MIRTYKDLVEYMEADYKANEGRKSYLDDLTLKNLLRRTMGFGGEFTMVRYYMRVLRRCEYYCNTSNSFFHRVMAKYYTLRHLSLSMKTGIHVPINVVGKGFRISHYTAGVIINCFKIGDFCSVASGVVVGNKDSQENRAIIGNKVKLTLGVKVIGKVVIGDNVIVAPNSVVVKDVEANSVVSGIPAKFIKYRENE